MKRHFTARTLLLVFFDALLLVGSGVFALLLRFDMSFDRIQADYLELWFVDLPLQFAVMLVVFWIARMYHFVWRGVGSHDVMRMVAAVLISCAIFFGISLATGHRYPRSIYVIEPMLQLFLFVGIRCAVHFYALAVRAFANADKENGERIMLIGAGDAGRILAHEFQTSNEISGKLCCAIDDDERKWGRYLEGVQIVGGQAEIHSAVKENGITQIICAIPSASPRQKRQILEICQSTGCLVRLIPGIYQMVNGDVSISKVKDLSVEDLLEREPVKMNLTMLNDFLRDKTVLVTGGGGSIGSELCRQIARYQPRKLIILDIYENNTYDIQQEMRRKYGDLLRLKVEIASVRDKERIYDIVSHERPDIIFHAAAHKHVPLMEECPAEAIKNNVFGTYHVVRAAEKFGVKKFVMISTDKAVNPTNVMGATKRFCEMVLQSRVNSGTEFCAVRFGNVLSSNGSVVPQFKRQIEEGGPVTITDKRITRYFMTISEAVQLVLEAGAMAKRGQIFVLDMGEPMKILTLAESMIRMAGFEPYRDIDIKEVGLRPGEKLYEELLMQSEHLVTTENGKIFIEQQEWLNPDEIMSDLELLDRAVTEGTPSDELIGILRGMIPTYHVPEKVNYGADQDKAAG